MNNELLPCPFCGNTEPKLVPQGSAPEAFVYCNKCDLTANLTETAIKRWNTRATPQIALKQVRDALEKGKIIIGDNIVNNHKHYDDVYSYMCNALATLDGVIANHIPDTSKMVVPEGYKMVPISFLKMLHEIDGDVYDKLATLAQINLSGDVSQRKLKQMLAPIMTAVMKSYTETKSMLSAAPTPAQPEKVDVEKLKLECVEMWSPNPVSSEAIKAVIGYLADTYDFVRKV